MMPTCMYCQLDTAGKHKDNCPAKDVNPIVNISTNTTAQMTEPNTKEDNFYQKSLNSVSIKTRLNGLFQWEWLIMNVPDERPPTAGELSEAIEWAHKLSEQVIKDFKTCEKTEPSRTCDLKEGVKVKRKSSKVPITHPNI